MVANKYLRELEKRAFLKFSSLDHIFVPFQSYSKKLVWPAHDVQASLSLSLNKLKNVVQEKYNEIDKLSKKPLSLFQGIIPGLGKKEENISYKLKEIESLLGEDIEKSQEIGDKIVGSNKAIHTLYQDNLKFIQDKAALKTNQNLESTLERNKSSISQKIHDSGIASDQNKINELLQHEASSRDLLVAPKSALVNDEAYYNFRQKLSPGAREIFPKTRSGITDMSTPEYVKKEIYKKHLEGEKAVDPLMTYNAKTQTWVPYGKEIEVLTMPKTVGSAQSLELNIPRMLGLSVNKNVANPNGVNAELLNVLEERASKLDPNTHSSAIRDIRELIKILSRPEYENGITGANLKRMDDILAVYRGASAFKTGESVAINPGTQGQRSPLFQVLFNVHKATQGGNEHKRLSKLIGEAHKDPENLGSVLDVMHFTRNPYEEQSNIFRTLSPERVNEVRKDILAKRIGYGAGALGVASTTALGPYIMIKSLQNKKTKEDLLGQINRNNKLLK